MSYTFKQGDPIFVEGSEGYFVIDSLVEWEKGLEIGWHRDSQVPEDYVSRGNNRYWWVSQKEIVPSPTKAAATTQIFKQGDSIKHTYDTDIKGIFVCYSSNSGSAIIEREDGNGWARSNNPSLIPSGYSPKLGDRSYWSVSPSFLVKTSPVKEQSGKWSGEGSLPERWFVEWEKRGDQEETDKHFRQRMGYCTNGVIDYKGGWRGMRNAEGMFESIPGEVEISMEQFRRHVMKSPVIEEGNPWGLMKGDLVTHGGREAYYIGKNARGLGATHVIEFKTHSSGQSGWTRTESIPTDYISIGSKYYWNVGSEEKLVRVAPAAKAYPPKEAYATCVEEKWAIRITEENRERVKKWFQGKGAQYYHYTPGVCYHYPQLPTTYAEDTVQLGYREINTEEFDMRMLGILPERRGAALEVDLSSLRPKATETASGAHEFYQRWSSGIDLYRKPEGYVRGKTYMEQSDAYMRSMKKKYEPLSRETIEEAIREMFWGKEKTGEVEKMPREVIITRPKQKGRRQLI